MTQIQINKRGKYITELCLTGQLGIQQALELATMLHEMRIKRPKLRVKCKHLESMDSSILQILHAAYKNYEEAILEEEEPAWQSSYQRAGLMDPFTHTESKTHS